MTSYREVLYQNYSTTKMGKTDTALKLAAKKPFFSLVIKHHFPADLDKRIIDFGCGDGALLYFTKQQGYQNVSGYDASAEQVQIAKSLGLEQIYLNNALLAASELPNHAADLIVSFDVIEHMTKEEVLTFSQAVYRILSPGGKWIIHTVNAESPFFGRICYGDLTHENGFTQTSIRQLLNATGFSKVFCYEDVPIAHGLKSAIRFVLWKWVRTFYRFCLAVESGDRDGIFSQNFLVVAVKSVSFDKG